MATVPERASRHPPRPGVKEDISARGQALNSVVAVLAESGRPKSHQHQNSGREQDRTLEGKTQEARAEPEAEVREAIAPGRAGQKYWRHGRELGFRFGKWRIRSPILDRTVVVVIGHDSPHHKLLAACLAGIRLVHAVCARNGFNRSASQGVSSNYGFRGLASSMIQSRKKATGQRDTTASAHLSGPPAVIPRPSRRPPKRPAPTDTTVAHLAAYLITSPRAAGGAPCQHKSHPRGRCAHRARPRGQRSACAKYPRQSGRVRHARSRSERRAGGSSQDRLDRPGVPPPALSLRFSIETTVVDRGGENSHGFLRVGDWWHRKP